MYNGNFHITRMLDQSNLRTQRCRLIFWVECSVGGHLVLAKTIVSSLYANFGTPVYVFVTYTFYEVCRGYYRELFIQGYSK
jgi:hypothetical protein